MGKKYEFDVFFDIIERPTKNGSVKMLVDNYGFICGAFKTYKDAKKAMKPIRRNIVREYTRRKKLGKSIPNPIKVSAR